MQYLIGLVIGLYVFTFKAEQHKIIYPRLGHIYLLSRVIQTHTFNENSLFHNWFYLKTTIGNDLSWHISEGGAHLKK